MHGILVALARLQTITNLRSYLLTLAAVLLTALALWSLGSDVWLLGLLAVVTVSTVLTVGAFFFLEAPGRWAVFLFHKAIYSIVSVFAASVRIASYSIAGLLSLIYFLWPIDLIPDVILIFGWFEDIAIAFGLFAAARSAQHRMPTVHLDFDPGSDTVRLLLSIAMGVIGTLLIRALVT